MVAAGPCGLAHRAVSDEATDTSRFAHPRSRNYAMPLPGISALAAGLILTVSCGPTDPPPQAADTLWESGRTFEAFLESTDRRRETWHRHWEWSEVEADVLARARALPGTWRLLVVAEDWCGDSANTIPYIARLVDEVEGLEMRIVDSNAGRGLMESHRTPDGRAATPTVVLLDAEGEEQGCWVERPSELQEWWIENPEELDDDTKLDRKYAWYDEDRGATTVEEIVGRLEAAAAGGAICR